eukprot:1582777-Rhodomonas_salina.1
MLALARSVTAFQSRSPQNAKKGQLAHRLVRLGRERRRIAGRVQVVPEVAPLVVHGAVCQYQKRCRTVAGAFGECSLGSSLPYVSSGCAIADP